MKKEELEIVFLHIEKEMDMQQACDCSTWCDCWKKLKLKIEKDVIDR